MHFLYGTLKRHLLTPDAVTAAVETYRTERHQLSQARARERSVLERELGEVVRRIGRMVESISGAGPSACSPDCSSAAFAVPVTSS